MEPARNFVNKNTGGLPMGSVGFYSHIIRRRVTEYPESTFSQPFASRFDAAYRATFDASGLLRPADAGSCGSQWFCLQ